METYVDKVEKDDVLMDDVDLGGSHPGNGYFSGLLLQKSRDFAHCNSEAEEKEIGAIVWSKIAEERKGKFLVACSDSKRFNVLDKAAVVNKICKAFKDLLPMARKKPRLEQPSRSASPAAAVSPNTPPRRLVWTEEPEEVERTLTTTSSPKTVGPSAIADTSSETESVVALPRSSPVPAEKEKSASSSNETASTHSANSQQEPEVVATTTATAEVTPTSPPPPAAASVTPTSPSNEKSSSSSKPVETASVSTPPHTEDEKVNRMLFKQLRALHREFRDMKQETILLQQDISRLTKDCGAFQREILALKKTRGNLQHELIELRNHHKTLASLVRNGNTSNNELAPRDMGRFSPERKDDILQQDLFELKRRLREQQRLTDSLLDGGGAPSSSSSLHHQDRGIDPALLTSLRRQGSYGMGDLPRDLPRDLQARDLPRDLPTRDHLPSSEQLRRSQNDEMARGLKRKVMSRGGWH